MSDAGYKIRDQNTAYFITFAVVEWVDVFTRKNYRDIVVDSLKYCQVKKGLNIHCWTIMSNHLHLIISTQQGNTLSEVLRDFKKFTSYEILRAIEQNPQESRKNWMLYIFRKAGTVNKRNSVYQFWRQGNHPKEIKDAKMAKQKMNYIHNNPVKAGFIEKAEDWIYSSASNYAGKKGLLDIVYID